MAFYDASEGFFNATEEQIENPSSEGGVTGNRIAVSERGITLLL
jgi:hypothetical protein